MRTVRQTTTIAGSVIGQALWYAPNVLAATGTTLDGAVDTFNNLFLLGLWLLGIAGFATIAYVVARNRYGMVWDEAISLIVAVALGASGVTLLGLVGSSQAATLPPMPLLPFP